MCRSHLVRCSDSSFLPQNPLHPARDHRRQSNPPPSTPRPKPSSPKRCPNHLVILSRPIHQPRSGHQERRRDRHPGRGSCRGWNCRVRRSIAMGSRCFGRTFHLWVGRSIYWRAMQEMLTGSARRQYNALLGEECQAVSAGWITDGESRRRERSGLRELHFQRRCRSPRFRLRRCISIPAVIVFFRWWISASTAIPQYLEPACPRSWSGDRLGWCQQQRSAQCRSLHLRVPATTRKWPDARASSPAAKYAAGSR